MWSGNTCTQLGSVSTSHGPLKHEDSGGQEGLQPSAMLAINNLSCLPKADIESRQCLSLTNAEPASHARKLLLESWREAPRVVDCGCNSEQSLVSRIFQRRAAGCMRWQREVPKGLSLSASVATTFAGWKHLVRQNPREMPLRQQMKMGNWNQSISRLWTVSIIAWACVACSRTSDFLCAIDPETGDVKHSYQRPV